MIPRTLSFPVLLLLLLSGCASLMQTPDAPVACGLPHCSLTRVEGVRVVTEDGERFLVHAGSAMRVAVAALPGTPTTGTANVDAVLAEWRPRLAPVVAWNQAPQEAPGFVVRGLSGDLRPPPGVYLQADPTKVWLGTYLNPNTGSTLVLRAEAPASEWAQGWAVFGPVVTRVALGYDF